MNNDEITNEFYNWPYFPAQLCYDLYTYVIGRLWKEYDADEDLLQTAMAAYNALPHAYTQHEDIGIPASVRQHIDPIATEINIDLFLQALEHSKQNCRQRSLADTHLLTACNIPCPQELSLLQPLPLALDTPFTRKENEHMQEVTTAMQRPMKISSFRKSGGRRHTHPLTNNQERGLTKYGTV